MTDLTLERIISADSHMLVTDGRVLAHLSAKHHDAYQEVQAAQATLAPALSNPDADEVSAGVQLPAAGRAGEWDGTERLKDMDLDGIVAEVIYTDTAAGSRFYKIPGDGCLA